MVTYAVARVFRAAALPVGAEISVRHPIVSGAPTVEQGAPRLDPAMFAEGSQLVLFLSKEGDTWTCLSERDGALPATPALVAQIAAATSGSR